jgi:hypothetical protein
MTFMQKSLSWLVVGALLTVVAAFAGDRAVAQSDLDPLEGLGTDDDGANIFGDTSDPYELIHRAILAPSMSTEEFDNQQNRLINGEASDFRTRQQELLQPQSQPFEAEEDVTIDGEAL